MTRRRIWPVSKWVGKGYPQVAPFVAFPACLNDLCGARGLRLQHRYLLVHLIERARQNKTDTLRCGARVIADELGISKNTAHDGLRRLHASGLVTYLASDGASEIGLEPCRVMLSTWQRSLETVPELGHPRTETGTGVPEVGRVTENRDGSARELGRSRTRTGTVPHENRDGLGSRKNGREEEEKSAREAAAGGPPPCAPRTEGYESEAIAQIRRDHFDA